MDVPVGFVGKQLDKITLTNIFDFYVAALTFQVHEIHEKAGCTWCEMNVLIQNM